MATKIIESRTQVRLVILPAPAGTDKEEPHEMNVHLGVIVAGKREHLEAHGMGSALQSGLVPAKHRAKT